MQRLPIYLTGAGLAFARRRVGLSQAGLAQRLSLHPSIVREWERSHDPIPPALYPALTGIIRQARIEQAQAEAARLAEKAATFVGVSEGRR